MEGKGMSYSSNCKEFFALKRKKPVRRVAGQAFPVYLSII
jgi:hypothetical protein